MKKDTSAYTTYAFISYSHRDMAVAKWLQKRLEAFRLPTEVHNDIEAGNRYLRPIFRDQSDLNTGILGDELRRHLEESKYLLLICSVHSAKSAWVSDEAKAFVEMGRLDRIIPVIIPDAGTPERELFPAFLRGYFKDYPDKELLGVNIGEVGKEKAFIRVVSRMLGVSFDSLWKRHQRQKRMRILSASVAGVVGLAATYLFAIPVSVSVSVDMEKADLPLGEDVTLSVNGGEYTSAADNPRFDKINIPGYRRFSDLRITAASRYYTPLDTVVPVGFGISRDVSLVLRRDATFAVYAGTVYDSEMDPLQDVTVTVAGHSSVTGPEGGFSIVLPLSEQRVELPITLEKEGYETVVREDETPGESIKFVMHR